MVPSYLRGFYCEHFEAAQQKPKVDPTGLSDVAGYIADEMLRAYKQDVKFQFYNRLHKGMACLVCTYAAPLQRLLANKAITIPRAKASSSKVPFVLSCVASFP